MDLNQLVRKDQMIKIVPSIEESLAKFGVNTALDINTQLWFNHLKLKWKTWKKSPATDNHFACLFQITDDPYSVALICSVKCEEYKDSKIKSLSYYIIKALWEWSCENGNLPPESLKLPAFHIAVNQRNQHFLNLIMKTFHVNTIKDIVIPIVKDMIRNDNCKQASQIVIAMELFDDIPVEDLLFPLILQDKANMIDEYLSEAPNQVRPLLLFLDRLLDKKFSFKDYVQEYIEKNKLCHVKYDKIHPKPLSKLVARLCNKYNVPIETCQNLSKNRITGGLRYLIHQKYIEHNVSLSVWDDLVKDSLRQRGCAHEFIDMLVQHDRNEALKWASYFQVPEDNLPTALKNLSLQDVTTADENWDGTSNPALNYYKLPLPENHIFIIDTVEKFYDVVTTLIGCSVVSIDCEWKPSFGAVQSQVALIQIATNDYIYLIDTITLNSKQYTSFWYRFNKSFLDNAEIIKLGFGLEQDLKEMKTIIGLGNIKIKGEGLLDLSLLWKSLINAGLSLPCDTDHIGNSLSSLVQACFGLPLEKSEQCSNWELRPLRRTQINYASLDAYVLLEIYNYLKKLCTEQEINFDEICNFVMLENKMKSTRKTKTVDRLQASTIDFQGCNIKILIEYELTYLAIYLRYCNIDTVVTTPTMLWHDTINLALSENRIILTAKLKFSPSSKFSQSLILDTSKGNTKEQMQNILTSFNIIVEQHNLLTRCLHCNGKEMLKLTPSEVKDLCNKYEVTNKIMANKTYDWDNEDNDTYDNFLSDSDGDDIYLCQPIKVVQPNDNNTVSTPCVTSKGATVDISDANRLSTLSKPATLCESCGKLYWDEDPLLKSAWEVISPFIDLSK